MGRRSSSRCVFIISPVLLAISTQRDELKEGISRVSSHIMYKPNLFSASATLPSSHQSCTVSSANCDSDVIVLPLAASCVRRKKGGAELLSCAGRSADEGVKEEGGISPRFISPLLPSFFPLRFPPSTASVYVPGESGGTGLGR